MSSSLQQIDGNRSFRGIIQTKRNAHALNARLAYQAGNIGFFYGQRSSNFFFSYRWKRLLRWCIEHQTGAHSVNRGRNARDGAARNMNQQSAFARVVRTGANAN